MSAQNATINFETQGTVAYITLNRPDAGNAINAEMAASLSDACDYINRHNEIRVALLQALGESFCLGSEAAQPPYAVSQLIAAVTKPVVAAIQGGALGQGLELALACDIRLAADNARFGLPQVAEGSMPYDGGTQRLPRLVGRGKALEMVLTGETIDAAEAKRIGLVFTVLPVSSLASEARKLVDKISRMAPWSLQFAKEAINKGMDLTLDQGIRLEADLYFLMHTTRDRTEGITAFLQKRPPVFEGK
ncbi:MAG: enoyl-CoA hydratase/isomerase family protein [Chloroflexi bacterium]|nr:enoyl-CoA hydratase/isomerase family protein [Chloroflexota bacterium]